MKAEGTKKDTWGLEGLPRAFARNRVAAAMLDAWDRRIVVEF